MAQVMANPEELERFAQSLRQFVDVLNDAVGDLSGAFAVLDETWQDQKRAQFEDEYHALVQQLKQFNANVEELIPYLTKLAARLQDYLQS